MRFCCRIFSEELSDELQKKYSWYDANPMPSKIRISDLTSENPIVFDKIATTLAKAFKLNKEKVKKILKENIKEFENASSENEDIFIHDFIHYLLDRYFFDKINKNDFKVDDYIKEIIITYLTYISANYAFYDLIRLLNLTEKKFYRELLMLTRFDSYDGDVKEKISFIDMIRDLEWLKSKAKIKLSKIFIDELIKGMHEKFGKNPKALYVPINFYYGSNNYLTKLKEDFDDIFRQMDVIPKGLVERIKILMNELFRY